MDTDERIHWGSSIPFFLVHLLGVGLPFVFGASWWLVGLALGSYAVRMFWVTAGYHRYFSHRSFKTGRVMQFLLAFLAQTSAQKGVLWWAGHHRHHHVASDTPDDVHSPRQRGFWWSHVGWILSVRYEATDIARIKDFAKYPELRFLDRWSLLPAVLYAVAIWAAFGWAGLAWGFFTSTVLLYHGTFVVNSLAHVFGRRRFDTGDDSRNSMLIALVTMGEGWHNNHHYYQSSASQGFYWWEVDLTWYGLKALSALGLITDLRGPPSRVLEEGRARHAPPAPAPATHVA